MCIRDRIETGYVPGRPSLGVEITVPDLQYRLYFNVPDGLYVTDVDEGSNAWSAGLRSGDVILSVSGYRVTSEDDLTAALGGFSVGDTVNLILYRSGRQLTADVILQEAGR